MKNCRWNKDLQDFPNCCIWDRSSDPQNPFVTCRGEGCTTYDPIDIKRIATLTVRCTECEPEVSNLEKSCTGEGKLDTGNEVLIP